jgi:hypothetical protein
MIVLEIEPNDNCIALDMRVFHELEAARPVSHVRYEHVSRNPTWYAVTGWSRTNQPVPAVAQKIDDSGDGVAFLIHGGDAGLRFKVEHAAEDWSLQAAQQWGEPYLVIADEADLRFTSD